MAPEAPLPEFPTDSWVRSTFCGPNGGNCVEVNLGSAGRIGVRDSKPAAGPALVFAGQDWKAFVADAASDRFGR